MYIYSKNSKMHINSNLDREGSLPMEIQQIVSFAPKKLCNFQTWVKIIKIILSGQTEKRYLQLTIHFY